MSFAASLYDTWNAFAAFVPNFIIQVILFIAGWVIASVIGKAISQVISALKIDKALESAGMDTVMNRAGITLNVGGFIGAVVKWFIIVVFLVTCLNNLGLSDVSGFLKTNILDYLPQVLKAALVLIIATVLADFLGKVVNASSRASGVRSANFLGTLVRYSIWIFAFIIVLGTLGIAAYYMQIIFVGLVAMLAIAGGLAFGLGGKEAAARAIQHLSDRVKPM
mgnify:CR=1 FL=1